MDSDPSPPPKDTGEEETRAPSSPSPRKRRQKTARRPSPSHCPLCGSPHSLLPPLPPLALPPGSGSIFTSSLEGSKRLGLLYLFLWGNETKGHAVSLSLTLPLSTFPLSSPSPCSSPTPPATPTHPLRLDVCIVVFPEGLIFVFIPFRLSRARLPHCVPCSAAPFAELPVPWPSSPRG